MIGNQEENVSAVPEKSDEDVASKVRLDSFSPPSSSSTTPDVNQHQQTQKAQDNHETIIVPTLEDELLDSTFLKVVAVAIHVTTGNYHEGDSKEGEAVSLAWMDKLGERVGISGGDYDI